jgi:hypothetical protein
MPVQKGMIGGYPVSLLSVLGPFVGKERIRHSERLVIPQPPFEK